MRLKGREKLISIMPYKRYFTTEEANKTLVLVRPIVTDICNVWMKLSNSKKLLESLVSSGRNMSEPEMQKLETEIDSNFKKIEHYMQELEQVGCLFKDFGKGLVDFPTFYKNTEVFLCWHINEDRVEFWHQHDTGFDGRKKIDEDFFEWNSNQPNVEFSLV